MLTVEGISKNFGAIQAVSRLSFSLEANNVLGIMGPNGAGKKHPPYLIMGVYPIDRGEILFEGRRIDRLSTSEISRIGIGRTYQIPQPFRQMTVLENILVGERYGGGKRSRGQPGKAHWRLSNRRAWGKRPNTTPGALACWT